MFDLDFIKTALDVGLGAVALMYVHRLGKLLDTHSQRLTALEQAQGRV